jgi:hypothetical protein
MPATTAACPCRAAQPPRRPDRPACRPLCGRQALNLPISLKAASLVDDGPDRVAVIGSVTRAYTKQERI